MAGIISDIDNLKHDIEKTNQALDYLFSELGKKGCIYHKAIAVEASNETFELLSDCKTEYDGITEQIEKVRETLRKFNSDQEEISKTKVTIRDLDNRKTTLIASLGAVACEMASQNSMPKSLEKCLSGAVDFENQLQRLIAKRDAMSEKTPSFLVAIADRRVEAMKSNINDIFYETGKRLLASENVREMDNGRAQAILDELDLIKDSRKNFHSMINSREEELRSALKGDNRTLREMQAKQEEVGKRLEALYTKYGSIIAKDMKYWLDSEAPAELKDVCSRIDVENRRLSKQNLNMDYLDAQKLIERNSNQLDQYNVQLSHLLDQRATIDIQIADLRNKISDINSDIAKLKNKQSDITNQVTTR